MLDFEKLKQKIANFDPNTAIPTVVSGMASMFTEDSISFGYLVIAAVTALVGLKTAWTRDLCESKMREVEVAMKEQELEAMRIDNEAKRLAITKSNEDATL